MAAPVVVVASGGLPVTNLGVTGGAPFTVVNDRGTPVTLVPSGAAPVTLLNPDGTLWSDELPPLALNTQFAIVGDSYVSRGYSRSGDSHQTGFNIGLVVPAMEHAGNGLQMAYKGNKAVSGTKIAQIQATMVSALATLSAPGLMILEGGINDVSAATSASTIETSWAQMIDASLSAGHRALILNMHPLKTPFGDARDTVRTDVNAYLASRATSSVKVFDGAGVGLVSGDYIDQLHLNSQGADKYGVALSAFLAPWMPAAPSSGFTTSGYLTNPGLANGTTDPTGWAHDITNAGGATVDFSKVGGKWRIAISGTYVGTGCYVEVSQQQDVAPNPQISELVEGIASYTIVGATTNLRSVDPIAQVFAADSTALVYAEADAAFDTLASVRAPGSYVAKTPVTKVDTAFGSASSNQAAVRIYLLDTASLHAVSATIDFDYINIRKSTP